MIVGRKWSVIIWTMQSREDRTEAMIVRRHDARQQPRSVNDGAIVIARDTLSIC